jgi:hypothetical protein
MANGTTVRFDTTAYQREHGKAPRGGGSWAFCPEEFERRSDYLDFTFWSRGADTFSAAKREAAAHFAAKYPNLGNLYVSVLS